MTRRPAQDERLLLPGRSGHTQERVYVKELERYLDDQVRACYRFAKRQGLLKWVSWGTSGAGGLWYVTPYGAQRVIAYIRARQGAVYLEGKDFHEAQALKRAKNLGWQKNWKARRAAAVQACSEDQHNPLAFSAAETDAQPKPGAARGER
jgi:hypothetical protein